MDTITIRNDTDHFNLYFFQPAPNELERQDITGWTIWFTAKRKLSDADGSAIIRKTTTSGITIVDAANGWAQVLIDSSDTGALEDRDIMLYFDVQIKDASGNVVTPIRRGTLLVECDVTQAVS